MIDRRIWVYDIETLKSCFTYSAFNIDTCEVVQYVIHEKRNNISKLIKHLNKLKGQIGFNNVNFDYPIIHYILKCYNEWINCNYKDQNEIIITDIYQEAQRIIEEQNKQSFNISVAIKQSEVLIPQLDLFKLWHYNNKDRSQSLKGLEIAMNYPNVMDMPIFHDREDISIEEVPSILEYNLNDVMATYEFYKLSKDKISLRRDLNTKYNLKCINFPDSKIGEQLVLKLYCEATGLNIWDVKKLRSNRLKIALKECIFDYIKFHSEEFNDLLSNFKSKVIQETKGSLEQSVIYKGFKYDFGSGGLHGCIKSGIYESDEDYIIIDADVNSLYPSIAVLNQLYPEHLGKAFCNIYENILNQRIEAKKAGNMTLSDGFKLSLNSVYG